MAAPRPVGECVRRCALAALGGRRLRVLGRVGLPCGSAPTTIARHACSRPKFGVPVCPHAGGVGLCEYVQHLAIFEYIAVSGSLEDRVVAYVDHLHEHFVDPAIVRDGRYVAPTAPGYSITMRPASLATFAYPDGAASAPRPGAALAR